MNEQTFDCIDNNTSHTLENCVLCCCKCNQRRGQRVLNRYKRKLKSYSSVKTQINRLIHDIDNHGIISRDTENIMTHVCGVDFNYLYPSAYSSIKTNKIDYNDGGLLMPGGLKLYTIDKNRIASTIQSREELFIARVKGNNPE
jgi:hypothetical protein